MADPLDEQAITLQVNHALKDLEEHLVRVWSSIAHLGECSATIKTTHYLSRVSKELRQLRADNYDAMRQKR